MPDNIFGNLSTPQWMSPADAEAKVAPFAESIARDYTTAYWHAKNNESQDERTAAVIQARQNQFQQQQDAKQAQVNRQAQKLSEITPHLVGAKTPAAAWQVVSQNPQWLVDPDTAGAVGNYLKTQASVAAAQKNSTAGAIAIADNTNFLKQLTQVDPLTRSQIQGMKSNDDGSPSPMMIQTVNNALATKEQSQRQAQDAARQAAIDAGGVPTTTIKDANGVTTTFKQPTASERMNDLLSKSDQMTLPDGSVITRGAGSHQWFKTANQDADPKPLTNTELRNLAKDLPTDDPRVSVIRDSLANTATNQVSRANSRLGVLGRSGMSSGPLSLPDNPSASNLKTGQQYKTKRGVATWNGTNFVQ